MTDLIFVSGAGPIVTVTSLTTRSYAKHSFFSLIYVKFASPIRLIVIVIDHDHDKMR